MPDDTNISKASPTGVNPDSKDALVKRAISKLKDTTKSNDDSQGIPIEGDVKDEPVSKGREYRTDTSIERSRDKEREKERKRERDRYKGRDRERGRDSDRERERDDAERDREKVKDRRHSSKDRGKDSALKALEVGVEGIIVSNHGAHQLDYVPATIAALEEVVLAVRGRIPVLFDGGIRRGTDIFKALALGAQAVLIGRPVVYGLAVKGEYGVRRVIEMLKDELELTMALSGCPTLKDITRNHVRTQIDSHHCRL